MKKSRIIRAVAICFGIVLVYMYYRKSSENDELKELNESRNFQSPTIISQTNGKNRENSNSFNSSDAEQYQFYKREYTPGYDKNCILTLPKKYIGEGELPLRLPAEEELNSLSADVIACLYHRYVTTIQTFCAFKDRAGEVKRNGWYICADPAYVPRKHCVVFLSNRAFPENTFSNDMVSRYKCNVYATPLSYVNTLKYWIGKTNISNSVIDILTMSVSTPNLALFHTIVQEKSILKVKQILLELYFDPRDAKNLNYFQILKSLRLLYERGFRIVWFDRLVHCATLRFSKCYAVYFVQPNLRDKTTNSLPLDLPTEQVIRNMKGNEIANLYFNYIETTQFYCQHVLRIGRLADGGWDVCHDKMLQYRNPCIVYSFGIRDDLSFDDDIATTYNCNVYAFDPTTPFGTHQHAPRVWFHRLGISSEYRKCFVAPLQKIRDDLNHQSSPIAILKADVEGAEWESVPNMINTHQLADVSQLFIEFHGYGDTPNNLIVLKRLHDAGFRIFWYKFNAHPGCLFKKHLTRRSSCQEVYFVNTKFKF